MRLTPEEASIIRHQVDRIAYAELGEPRIDIRRLGARQGTPSHPRRGTRRAPVKPGEEAVGTAIDPLARVQRPGWRELVARWRQMRRARNWLVHEYLNDPADMLPALSEARAFVAHLRCLAAHAGLRHNLARTPCLKKS